MQFIHTMTTPSGGTGRELIPMDRSSEDGDGRLHPHRESGRAAEGASFGKATQADEGMEAQGESH